MPSAGADEVIDVPVQPPQLAAAVGRLLDASARLGRLDNTIVVLWSDHGWHLGEKLITGKNTLWERSTHVPLVFAGPGITQGRCHRPAELLDISLATAKRDFRLARVWLSQRLRVEASDASGE